ncbi:alpha/beta fold hydrolase [Parahaliea mediterranea]|uniref:alpha/beta fold hydrolase n=1 Tax=Parahaliea mediterranea TaxID=651086 RepID=UPI000E2F2FFE|nr:alpha/beta fold hydrolase [Parahaliea mediterranea]
MALPKCGKFLKLKHGRVHYFDVGCGDTVLFLHGSGPGVTGRANYAGNIHAFAGHFRCIVMDFPGYGASDSWQGDALHGCIEAAIALLDGLGIKQAHIVGNSLGGIVGGYIAARHPQRVGKLVSIGGIGINLFTAFPGEGLNLLTEFVEDPTRSRLEQWLRSMVYDQSVITDELIDERFQQSLEPKTFYTTRSIYARESIQGLAQFRKAKGAIETIAHLPDIQAPTLITWGREDRVSSLDVGLIAMRLIPNCEFHIFPNCGHWTMHEFSSGFESVVFSFLQRK